MPKIKKSEKLNKRQSTLFAFNYTVGFAFFFTIGFVFKGMGMYTPLIILGAAGIVFVIGKAFSHLSEHYDISGGSYIYARDSLGRYGGWIIGLFSYIQAPLVWITIPLLFKSVFDPYTPNNLHWVAPVVSFLVFFILSMATATGLKVSKKVILIISLFKWIIIFSAIAGLIAVIIKHPYSFNNVYDFATSRNITFIVVVNTLINFMWAYGGFESIPAMAGQIENPRKNISKILFKVIFWATSLYLVFYTIFFFTPILNNAGNPFSQIWDILTPTSAILGIVMGIGFTFNKLAAIPSSAIVNGGYLSSMASDGQIPIWFSKHDNNGNPRRAIWLDAIVKTLFAFSFTIIPLIVDSELSLSDAIDIWAIALFVEYIGALLAVMIFHYHHKLNIKKYEIAMFITTLLVIISFMFAYLFTGIGSYAENPGESHWWQLATTTSVFIIGTLGYFINWIFNKDKNWWIIKHSHNKNIL